MTKTTIQLIVVVLVTQLSLSLPVTITVMNTIISLVAKMTTIHDFVSPVTSKEIYTNYLKKWFWSKPAMRPFVRSTSQSTLHHSQGHSERGAHQQKKPIEQLKRFMLKGAQWKHITKAGRTLIVITGTRFLANCEPTFDSRLAMPLAMIRFQSRKSQEPLTTGRTEGNTMALFPVKWLGKGSKAKLREKRIRLRIWKLAQLV